MPHVIGGKQVYGLSRVGLKGKIIIPKEAFEDYKIRRNGTVVLISRSRLSNGFDLTTPELIKKSRPLQGIFKDNPELERLGVKEGRTIDYQNKMYCWVKVNRDFSITIPIVTLAKLGLQAGDLIPSVGGNNLLLLFPAKGPIVTMAQKSSEVGIYEDRGESAKIQAAKTRKIKRGTARRDILNRRKSEAKTAKKQKDEEGEEETLRIGLISTKFRRRKR
jgi:bifunctional DNA-binding transcriptional regulator/antitoxin component of YhaV-PrlF toxin-antitoxin module